VNEIVGGRYKLIKPLGAGGMAEVFLAEQTGPRGFARQAVIKRIHSHLAKDPVFTASFEQEARLAAQLQHPHIVRTEDFGDDDGNLYIVLEYVQGDELARLSKYLNSIDQRLPLSIVLQIGADIADALDFAHKMPDGQGVPLEIVHRDVSPQNIMLNAAGQAKLLDFGIARAASNESITEAGKVKGKIAYFCPEQARGEHLDGRCDQFALAIVLYELLARKRLFADRDVMATLNRVNRCKVPSLLTLDTSIPRALDGALLRALSRGKAQRFADCAAFSEALSECLEVHGGRWSARRFGRWRSAFPDSLASKPGKYFAPLVAVADAQADAPEDKTLLEKVEVEPISAPSPEGDSDQTVATIIVSEALDLTVADGAPPAFLENSNIIEVSNGFFGRGEELGELKACIDQGHRLITLVGAGGSGKTRLSQHFGLQQTAGFAGGVWFCDLSEARGAAGLAAAMGSSLDLQLDQSDPKTQIATALLGRGHALVILDNVEQILDDAAAALKTWLQKAPRVVFLLTSRSPVRLQDEVVIRLDPLPIAEAMQLFYHRGQAVRSNFIPNDSNQPIVKEIVERLDCMPLAIELAAVRVRSLSLEQIRQQLKQRFRLLRGERRDQAARQATLQGTIDWSWNLLKPSEQSVLAQLAIFRGGCTIEAAESVINLQSFDDAPWVVDCLQSLVDHSLLRRLEPLEGHSRYRMLESVREYAAMKLADEAPAVVLRHAQYFATFGSEEFLDSLDRHGGVQRRQMLALEMENLIAGVESGMAAGEPETAAYCGLAAGVIFELKGPYLDGISLLNRVTTENLEPGLKALLILRRGALLWHAGQVPAAAQHYDQALAISREAGNRSIEGRVLAMVAILWMRQSKTADALKAYEQALLIFREVGERRFESGLLHNLGLIHSMAGRNTKALAYYEQALVTTRESGNRRHEGLVLGNLALLHVQLGQTTEALTCYEQALAIARETGNRRTEGIVLGNLGDLRYDRGESHAADQYLQQAIEIGDEVFPADAACFRSTLALVRAENGAIDEARTLLEKGDSQLRGIEPIELAKLLCKRARVEHLAGETTAASAALAEAETIAAEVEAGADSELGQELTKARTALTD
jgi:predicted ATPase/serine/threonine protein kinase/tetratricopeptide (TPR) repeat protein